MCLRELCVCFRPDTDEGPDLRRTPSVKQRFEQPKMTRDGDTYQKPDIIFQPKAKDANGTANGADGFLTGTPRNYSAWDEDKDTDFTRKSEAAGRAIANPEKSNGLKASMTKAVESNERDKIPPKAIASYEVLAPKEQTKAAGYEHAPKDQTKAADYELAPKDQRKAAGYEHASKDQTKAAGYEHAPKDQTKAAGCELAPKYQTKAAVYEPAPKDQTKAAGYELAPKDQTKAAGYDGDDGERVGRRPQ